VPSVGSGSLAEAGRGVDPDRDDPVVAAILAAAARRFIAVGVTKTTMAEIAQHAGTTKPTLYKRFPDKTAVVDALVRLETVAFTKRLGAAAGTAGHSGEALVEAFVAAVGWLDRHPFLRKSLDLEPQLLLPYLTDRRGPVLTAGQRAFREIVDRGVAAGELQASDPAAVAEVWWRLVLSYALTPDAGARRRTPTTLRALARDVLLGALQP
jgi:AcrR family transcriptional regulator